MWPEDTVHPEEGQPAARSADSIADSIAAEQLAQMYRLTPAPVWAGLGFSAVVAALALLVVPMGVVAAWCTAQLLISWVRATETARFEADPKRLERTAYWRQRYIAWMVANCLIWAAMFVLFGPHTSGITFALILAGTVGIASVGVFTTFSVLPASLWFLASLLGPMVLWFLWLGGSEGLAVASGGIIYAAVLSFEAQRSQARQAEMLRLRLENAAIAEERTHALAMAEHSNRAKSRFLAAVSHEMRTPLNGILGMSELMRDDAADSAQRHRAEVVLRSADHLHRVIGDLLDLSRLEFSRLRLETAPFCPGQALRDVIDLLEPVAAERGLKLRRLPMAGEPGLRLGDAARVKQVLHNMVGNALKFSSQGEVEIALATSGPQLRYLVRDHGPGVPAARRESIFEPFEQAGAAPEAQRQGAGLGLTISRRLARAMGGDVICTEPPADWGAGAQFEFTLHAPMAPAAPPGTEAELVPHLRGRVLVVDDNQVNALVAQAMLARLGLQADCAGDGQEALQALERERFDAVLMDCRMPHLDGWQATRQWRTREQGRRLPIIGVTANVSAEDRRACLDAGMDAFLGKPYRISELAALLQKHLAPA